MNIFVPSKRLSTRPCFGAQLDPEASSGAPKLQPRPRACGLFIYLAGAMVASGAAASGATPPGVQGTVTLSPVCGGAQREGDACVAPFGGVEVRLIAQGDTVAGSARTSDTGRFVIAAPAGRYRVQVATGSKVTRCPQPEVVVTANALSRVDIECDSGMR